MSGSNTIFTGASRYSGDFQKIIGRALAIASLPLSQLRTQKAALDSQSAAFRALESKVVSVRNAIESLAAAAANNSFSSSVSDGSVARATVSAGALAGVYRLEVLDAGSFTSAISADGLAAVADPAAQSISAAEEFTLTVDGSRYVLRPKSNTLNALADAINASEAKVEATVVNIGGSASPDYRLSVRATRLGAVAVQLDHGGAELLDTLVTGERARYRVNGQPPTAIQADSRTVDVAPGLKVTFFKAGSAEVTLTRDTSGVANALSSFVAAYNSAVDAVDSHRGRNGGALAGQSLLNSVAQALRETAAFTSSGGGITSLAGLGVSFTDGGKLSFDANIYSAAASGRYATILEFLGTPAAGGFLGAAGEAMKGLTDPAGGVFPAAASSLEGQAAFIETRIQGEQARVDRMEEALVARMAAADALVASLEQQAYYINNLFQSMRTARERIR